MNEWIPVHKKLPEHNDIVLVTLEEGTETDAGTSTCNQVHEAVYIADVPFNYFGLIGWGEGCYREEILAWMPLPEAYKEETA